MSNNLTPPSKNSVGGDAVDRELTPIEIDARHARQLLERALTQLERGERHAAELSCKQAIHLAPNAWQAHSIAGLLEMLEGHYEAARNSYEKATADFRKATPERERLIALRMALAENKQPDIEELIPNLTAEIARLHQVVNTAPPSAFRNHHTQAAPAPAASGTVAAAATAGVLPDTVLDARPDFAERLERRKRTSTWIVAGAAVLAALASFLIVRALFAPSQPTEVAPVPAVSPQTSPTAPAAAPTPEQPAPGETPAVAPGGAALPTPTPEPVATPTPTATPKPTPAPTQRPAPRPTPRVEPHLPQPAAPPRPQVTPRPQPTPHIPEPVLRLPPPRVELPSAGGEKPEFPRVLPDND